ncbi:hypothetical protein MMC06_004212 [Schaereria dolodes]|nr:hypothetical protein [Schaereria dolodes]
MSLYYDGAQILSATHEQSGSLKSRVFAAKDLKSTPAQLFALVSETSKWSFILKEVVEKSKILVLERKLSPALALLLVHDLLLAKKGVAAPATHPLRLAVTRHKARLQAELTKERLRRGYASLDALRQDVEGQQEQDIDLKKTKPEVGTNGTKPKGQALLSPHPRWIRINTLKTSLDMQLASTFSGYRCVLTLHEVLNGKPLDKVLHIDEHIPNLLALPPAADLSTTPAYRKGLLIFQDKASCFPAYLLDPQPGDGDCLDACAAPGNKTTHLAALTHGSVRSIGQSRIWACERDKSRAKTLEKMVDIAGADELVTIKAGQDFLRLDPEQSPWRNVRSLLLDPSCSGSGIIGRDEILPIVLPAPATPSNPDTPTRKRKRSRNTKLSPTNPEADVDHCASKETTEKKLQARLDSLSAFQTNMLLHAFKFPRARKITEEEWLENLVPTSTSSRDAGLGDSR